MEKYKYTEKIPFPRGRNIILAYITMITYRIGHRLNNDTKFTTNKIWTINPDQSSLKVIYIV